ncbi:MAG: RagB/SusD family nutrient uptake outer membrane protein [Chitinophagaceae bacterium]|nr:RagB/SusD family nutrient uptake outer membrane protein [Chitinophagaceae bacterium]MCW5926892.1 RagB/SusD family nutrient uptake outer membrane protein [Chitinophagaceae bacterium]
MNQNKSNKFFPLLLILVLAGVGFVSCKKNFLDRKPLGRYTVDDVSIGAFDGKVFGAYAILRRSGFNSHLYLGIHSYRSDESQKGSTVSDGADHGAMYDDFQYVATNFGIQEYWTDHYAAIIAANEIVKAVDSLGAQADEMTLINRAEAKFIRAFCYFDLARTFGRVPKIDFTGTAADLNIAKVENVAEIFTLIDEDLQEAVNMLPVNWEPGFIGRGTKGAALGLRTRTYMWRSNWAAALASANEIGGLGIYSLVPNYRSQFTKEGENGPESLFEIQAYYIPTNDQGIIYANVQGVRGSGEWDLGWGWNAPTSILENAFEDGDPRKAATLLYSGQVDPYYGGSVPGYPAPLAQPYWNMKVYTNPADRLSLNNRFGRWMNHRIIRYADILLMAAEAANELGQTQAALDYLEMVRGRARGNNAGILPEVTTTNQADLRNAIRHERMVELGMEEQRFWDIVRWGIDITVLPAAGKTAYQAKHRLLPIPQGEIDKSGGVLIQNPDY